MKTILSFVLVLGCVVMATAQERVMDKAEFDAIVAKGHGQVAKWKGEKYRMTVSTSSRVTGRPQTDHSSTMITEFGPSMETRNISTSIFGGKPTPRRESLRIGNSVYTRFGDGAWSRKEYTPTEGTAIGSAESPRKILSSQAEYKYLGQSTFRNKPVQLYVVTERRTTLNETSGENSESESKNTYWFDETGAILKSDFASEHRGKITSQTTVTIEWEVDPSITFTAPEIL